MANNGVSHLVVPDEKVALSRVLDWLSFVPLKAKDRLLVLQRPLFGQLILQLLEPALNEAKIALAAKKKET
ncbi:unnamed protein product [Protopolystoma xenopodis]|uniref:CoA carboxyltransferase N-terminal domain-containing protein n=1 Tax=Protopolystoma xenopodis TaxID=117903 RepID=A0A448WS91_9PLAT|nr:unnamed protein product [Protopolystoma xenopodis]